MPNDKLKPCPFCGEKVRERIDRYDFEYRPVVECSTHGVFRIPPDEWNKRACDEDLAQAAALLAEQERRISELIAANAKIKVLIDESLKEKPFSGLDLLLMKAVGFDKIRGVLNAGT